MNSESEHQERRRGIEMNKVKSEEERSEWFDENRGDDLVMGGFMLRVSMGNEKNDEINLNFSRDCIDDSIILLGNRMQGNRRPEAEIKATVIKFCQREGDLYPGTKNLDYLVQKACENPTVKEQSEKKEIGQFSVSEYIKKDYRKVLES